MKVKNNSIIQYPKTQVIKNMIIIGKNKNLISQINNLTQNIGKSTLVIQRLIMKAMFQIKTEEEEIVNSIMPKKFMSINNILHLFLNQERKSLNSFKNKY